MSKEDDTYRKVMDALKNQKGMTQRQREDHARKVAQGEAQSKRFKEQQARAKKLRDKKRKNHGGDDVIDTGMFGS